MKVYLNGILTEVEEQYTSEQIAEFEKEGMRGEIESIKSELAALDYKTIKRLQGALSDEEWEATKKECASLRQRINELEAELAAMEEI